MEHVQDTLTPKELFAALGQYVANKRGYTGSCKNLSLEFCDKTVERNPETGCNFSQVKIAFDYEPTTPKNHQESQ